MPWHCVSELRYGQPDPEEADFWKAMAVCRTVFCTGLLTQNWTLSEALIDIQDFVPDWRTNQDRYNWIRHKTKWNRLKWHDGQFGYWKTRINITQSSGLNQISCHYLCSQQPTTMCVYACAGCSPVVHTYSVMIHRSTLLTPITSTMLCYVMLDHPWLTQLTSVSYLFQGVYAVCM